MGQKIASLEIELAMATGGAVSDLNRFGGAVDKVSAQAIRDLDRIDAAMTNVGGMDSATQEMVRFADQTAKSAVSAAREMARIERAGESMAAQLERQLSVFGKTSAEVRSLKAETAALAAEQAKMPELASHIRETELAIEREEAAVRSAALAYQMFEAAARAGMAAHREQQAAEAAVAAEAEAQALRSAAVAYQQFEAAARRGMVALREQQAAEAAATREAQALATAVDRFRASIDPAYAAQQRFNSEMSEARTLIGFNAISLDEYCAKLRIEQKNLDDTNAAHARGVTSLGAHRAAMQGASYQVQDFITQVSMGQSPINAFAVQGGQLAGQFANIGGKAGDVARFFIGPWGLAITAGLVVLAPFVSKLMEGNHALDDAIDKLKQDAAASEINRQAKLAFAHSVEGVAKAIRDSTEATRKAIETEKTAAEQNNINARANLIEETSIRNKTAARLADARALLEAEIRASRANGDRGEVATMGIASKQAQVDAINRQLVEQTRAVTEAQANLERSRVALAAEQAKADVAAQADPIARINRLYDDQVTKLNESKAAAIARGETIGAITKREYEDIERNRQAALKAEQDRQHAEQQTAQIGRQIDLEEGERIARSIGARITSERRSYAEQKALYDKYMAYRAGNGPWAALAAKPGTSDHEAGNALDIAKTPGMSLAKIRDAYREAGVSIKQLLDEGNHFHIAWKKGADAAAAAEKKVADAQAGLAKQFDPALAAANEYQEAVKKIAEAKLDPETATRYAAAAEEAFRKARAAAFTLPSMADVAADAKAQEAADKSAEDFERNVIQPLKDELALYGLVGAARAAAALELDKEAFIAKYVGEGLDVATARWKEYCDAKRHLIDKDRTAENEVASAKRINDQLQETVDLADRAADAMSNAFGRVGNSIGDVVKILARYAEQQSQISAQVAAGTATQADGAKKSADLQIASYIGITSAAKNLFSEHSAGYEAMATAEKVLTGLQLIRLAASIKADAQDILSTAGSIARSAARTAAHAVEAVVKAMSTLPPPLNFIAGAATIAALAGIGVSIAGSLGGNKSVVEPANSGTGTVLGNSEAKSDSIKNAIDALKAVDLITNSYSRQMAASLKSIDSQIGNVASLVVRSGLNDSKSTVAEGFKPNAIGSLLGNIPLIGGFLPSLFGSKTTVLGNGLYGGAQSLGSILSGGFNASSYTDVEKVSKFLGITTSKKTSTQYAAIDPTLGNQFTLILRSFNDAISAAAGPLGQSTQAIQDRLNGFVVNIGKIDLKGLTGDQIQEKLNAVFGAAADNMASAAFPGIERFQKVGEGAFQTLVRVSSTVEAVTTALDQLGASTKSLGIDAKLGLADQFGSISDLTSAVGTYFDAFYSKE